MNPPPSSQKCYYIYYTKDIVKRKKTYKQGILIITINNNAKIFDEDGQLITNFKIKQKIQIDSQYTVNNTFLITIDKQGNIDDYTSGAIFIKKQSIMIPITKKQITGLNIYSKNYKQQDIIKLQCGLVIQKKLYDVLRLHQKQGIQFMFNCITGKKNNNLHGCILADFMGLGKTLQTLVLAYSMIKQKLIKKFVIVCPLTLLTVWEKQTKKWLQQRIIPLICYGDGIQTTNITKIFANQQYRMLVISYQTFYRNIDKLSGKCDLIVFDQGHRMKNKKSKLLLKMKIFKCEKRILLTGTLIQNNLQQLYTCISIINPLIFSSQLIFKNVYQKPIVDGLSKHATPQQKSLAYQRTNQLARQIKQFSLRRNIDILQQFLPEKYQYLIFMTLTELQKNWYQSIVDRIKYNQQDLFCTLNSLRKLFIHPNILKTTKINHGQSDSCPQSCQTTYSSKIQFTLKVIQQCVKNIQKCVIVSYYTQTLDFIASILKSKNINFTQLDGRLKGSQRKHVIKKFEHQVSVLLLSGKAGGTGLTLTCATHMILIQPDWNPSNDSQVMGRIWRTGQTKIVHIYRLIISSTFQQKMLQRQQLKKQLSNHLIDNNNIIQQQSSIDYSNLNKLFIQYQNHVITFNHSQNQLALFISNNQRYFNNNNQNYYINNHGIIFVKINKTTNQTKNTIPHQNQFNSLKFSDFIQNSKQSQDKQNYNVNNTQNQLDQDNSSQDQYLSNSKIDQIYQIPQVKKNYFNLIYHQQNHYNNNNTSLNKHQKQIQLHEQSIKSNQHQNKLHQDNYKQQDWKKDFLNDQENNSQQQTKYQNLQSTNEKILITKTNSKTETVPFGTSNLLKKIKKL